MTRRATETSLVGPRRTDASASGRASSASDAQPSATRRTALFLTLFGLVAVVIWMVSGARDPAERAPAVADSRTVDEPTDESARAPIARSESSAPFVRDELTPAEPKGGASKSDESNGASPTQDGSRAAHAPAEFDFEVVLTVFGPDGAAVEGAIVAIVPPSQIELGGLAQDAIGTTTGADGIAALRGRGWGRAVLKVDASGTHNLRPHSDVLILAGRLVFEVWLSKGHEVSGVALWPLHSPQAARQAWLKDLAAEVPVLAIFDADGVERLADVGEGGAFGFRGLGPPPYMLTPKSTFISPFAIENIPADATSEALSFTMKPTRFRWPLGLHMGEIHGTAYGPLPRSVRAVSVEHFGREDRRDDEGLRRNDLRRFELRPNGDYHLTGLQPGEYMVIFEAEDGTESTIGPIAIDRTTIHRVR